MIILFISGIILARLLTPYDYGRIGMLMIFMVLAEAFIDGVRRGRTDLRQGRTGDEGVLQRTGADALGV